MPLRLNSPDNADRTAASALLSPSWATHHRSQSSASQHGPQNTNPSFRDNLIDQAGKLHKRVVTTYEKMSILQRIGAIIILVVAGVAGLLFLIYNEKILVWLSPYAIKWKRATGGWVVLWAVTFVAAFPPMIGYSLCGTMAGFVYGVGEGWLILATATVLGSYCSFIASRTVLRKYVERLVANNKQFAALSLTLKQDGLKLLCMIRLCPLPYSISNGAMSTFPTVEPHMYALATALVTPKLLIHVFIGSRLAIIAQEGGQMSAGARAVNYLSIVFGAVLGLVTGRLIYQKTMARAHELEAEETLNVRASVRRTGAPPREFADDPEAQVAAQTLAADDDDIAYFDEAPSPRPPYLDSHADLDVFDQGDEIDGDSIRLHGTKK